MENLSVYYILTAQYFGSLINAQKYLLVKKTSPPVENRGAF
jgi:hypothetical protein